MAKIRVPIGAGAGAVLKVVKGIHRQVDRRFARIEKVLERLVAQQRKPKPRKA